MVGAGSVEATLAYASLIRGAAKTMALYDLDRDKVRAEVLDLNHGSQFYPTTNVIGSDDIAVSADADIVVITAGAKQKPGQTRLDLAAVNVEMCRSLVPEPHECVAIMTRASDGSPFRCLLRALAALSVVAVLLAGCGSTKTTTSSSSTAAGSSTQGATTSTSPASSSDKPAYCTSLSNLQQSVDALKSVDVKKSGTDALKSAVAQVQMNATTVVDDARGEFETQTAALKASVDTLSGSVKGSRALPPPPSSPRCRRRCLPLPRPPRISITPHHLSASDPCGLSCRPGLTARSRWRPAHSPL